MYSSMTHELEFTDEEIRRHLASLGFRDVSHQQFQLFKSELEELLQAESNDRQENIENVGYERFEYDDEPIQRVQTKPADPVLIEKVPVEELNFRPNSRIYRKEIFDQVHEWEEDSSSRMNSKAKDWARNGDRGTHSESNSQLNSISSDLSSNSSRPQIRKRKVLRKKHGKVNIEVYESSVANTKSSLELNSCDTNSEITCSRSSATASSTNDVPKRWKSVNDLGITKKSIYRSKSVLLPYSNNTQAHVYYKSDPVSLFHYYKREWSNFNIPGEKDHRELRWSIRQSLNQGFCASRK